MLNIMLAFGSPARTLRALALTSPARDPSPAPPSRPPPPGARALPRHGRRAVAGHGRRAQPLHHHTAHPGTGQSQHALRCGVP